MDVVASGDWLSVWRLGASVTSVETRDHAMVRPWEAWGPRGDLERAAEWWQARGLRAPSSPASLIRKAASDWYRPVLYTRHGWALHHLAGGWQETEVRGTITGPHILYDMRRAYRWALTAGDFPDRRSITVARQWRPTWPGLHLLDVEPWPGAPWPMRDGGPVLVETPEDIERYGMPTVREWQGGVYWHRTLPTGAFGELIDSTGVPACQRVYWGPWVAQTPVTRTTSQGTVSELPPRGLDAVRGHLVLQRVRRRLADVAAPYRYIDSVLAPAAARVRTGDDIGDWRIVREYPDGVAIDYPGSYGPAAGPRDRQSGIKREA